MNKSEDIFNGIFQGSNPNDQKSAETGLNVLKRWPRAVCSPDWISRIDQTIDAAQKDLEASKYREAKQVVWNLVGELNEEFAPVFLASAREAAGQVGGNLKGQLLEKLNSSERLLKKKKFGESARISRDVYGGVRKVCGGKRNGKPRTNTALSRLLEKDGQKPPAKPEKTIGKRIGGYKSSKQPKPTNLDNRVLVGVRSCMERLEKLVNVSQGDRSRIEELIGKAESYNSPRCIQMAEDILIDLERNPCHTPDSRILPGLSLH